MKRHDQFETFTQAWLAEYHTSGKTISCRNGCSGCCHLAVHATYPEAAAVANALTEPQLKKLSDYIERLKGALPDLTDLKSYLKKHRQALGPCPFLDEQGSCSIYPIRPLSCRALLSTRPAAWCTVDFSELDRWDKQAYAGSLDRKIVAWPTHYVAATQDMAREMESALLEEALRTKGWALSGNFAALVWLERSTQLNRYNAADIQRVHDLLTASGLFNQLLLNFTANNSVRHFEMRDER